MQGEKMKIAIILGSTRPGRQTDRMAMWVRNSLTGNEGVEATLLDLSDYDMPFFNEPVSPKYNPDRQPTGVVKRWLDTLSSFDAYIIVTPEYNHSIPAVLKNALDYTDFQVAKKPFAIVSHGSAGGARAAAHLKNIISEINGMVISKNIAFAHRVGENFDEHGNITNQAMKDPQHGPEASLKHVINELAWYSDALAKARSTNSGVTG